MCVCVCVYLQAKENCNGLELDGRRIRVDYSITKRAHTPTPGVYMGRPTKSKDDDRDKDRDRGRDRDDRYDDRSRYDDKSRYDDRGSGYDRDYRKLFGWWASIGNLW